MQHDTSASRVKMFCEPVLRAGSRKNVFGEWGLFVSAGTRCRWLLAGLLVDPEPRSAWR